MRCCNCGQCSASPTMLCKIVNMLARSLLTLLIQPLLDAPILDLPPRFWYCLVTYASCASSSGQSSLAPIPPLLSLSWPYR